MSPPLHIACSTTREFLPHCATMVRSAAVANPGATIHVLHGDDLSARSRSKLESMVDDEGAAARCHRVSHARLQGLPGAHPAPPSAWYRLLLPEIVDEAERVIYLDGDAIVLEALEELWRLDLGGALVGAVTNVLQDEVHEGHVRDIGVRDPSRYFNSGVLLMDLEALRAEVWSETAIDLATRMAAELSWYDQDVLNLTLGERRFELHPRWNCMNSLFFFPWSVDVFGERAHEEACASPAVRHFEGPGENKPWHPDCVRPMHELYGLHRSATPWPDRGPGRIDEVAGRLRALMGA